MNRAIWIALIATLLMVTSVGFLTKRHYDRKLEAIEASQRTLILDLTYRINEEYARKANELDERLEALRASLERVESIRTERTKKVAEARSYTPDEIDRFFEERGIK